MPKLKLNEPKVLEKDIKRAVRTYLKIANWKVLNIFQGLGCEPGISDLICIKDGFVLFIEIKTKTGKQSEKQIAFEMAIRERGGMYAVIRSVDELVGYIKIIYNNRRRQVEALRGEA